MARLARIVIPHIAHQDIGAWIWGRQDLGTQYISQV